MNIEKSKNIYFRKEIFPKDFSLEGFERKFTQNQNIIKDDRNIIKILRFGEIETVTKSFKTQILFMELSINSLEKQSEKII